LAFIQKQHMDADGPGQWTAQSVLDFSKEQPVLLFTILENIKECFATEDCYEEHETHDKIVGDSAAGHALYITLMTYGLVKAAVEGEQLNDLFGEDE